MKREERALMSMSRRERQIFDIIYRKGRASAAEVTAELPDAPSYSSVRTLLSILEKKGHIKHTEEGGRYIYFPRRTRKAIGQAALKRALHTFYEGSVEKAVAALLDISEQDISPEEMKRITNLIEQAKKEGQ